MVMPAERWRVKAAVQFAVERMRDGPPRPFRVADGQGSDDAGDDTCGGSDEHCVVEPMTE
jgi:hypothetical protein